MTYALLAYGLMGFIVGLVHMLNDDTGGWRDYLKTALLWPVRIWRWIP